MRLLRTVFVFCIAIFSATLMKAQPPLEWVPQGVEALRQVASSKTEFTLDHSMLVFASKLDPDNEDLRRVIAGVNGVSVHNYHFSGHWLYDPEVLNSVAQECQAAGWKRMVNSHEKDGGPGMTEVWIAFQHKAISNIAILVAGANDVSFISVSGSISPLDLTHLGGHFGIPRIEGGVLVPNARHP
jgi:Domain of unknown function (DUF4252)